MISMASRAIWCNRAQAQVDRLLKKESAAASVRPSGVRPSAASAPAVLVAPQHRPRPARQGFPRIHPHCPLLRLAHLPGPRLPRPPVRMPWLSRTLKRHEYCGVLAGKGSPRLRSSKMSSCWRRSPFQRPNARKGAGWPPLHHHVVTNSSWVTVSANPASATSGPADYSWSKAHRGGPPNPQGTPKTLG